MATFAFTLRTPLATVFEGDVDVVRLKTDLGLMEILPEHATLVGTILFSRVSIWQDGKEVVYLVRQGSVSVDESGVARVACLIADPVESLDVQSIENYLRSLTEMLDGERELNDYQKTFLQEQRAALEESLRSVNA